MTGPRESFDYLLDALDIQPAINDLSVVGLAYDDPEETPKTSLTEFFLTSGEWFRDRLSLGYKGELPNLEGATVVIGNQPFPIETYKQSAQGLEIELLPEAAAEFEQPKSVCLRWVSEEEVYTSNPIFACNRAALERELSVSDQDDAIRSISKVDLGDEEIEQLLEALNQILLVDRHGIWQLAGRGPQAISITDEEDAALHIDYTQVDYEALRTHPKILQYQMRGGPGHNQTKLQRLLQAITDHFQNLIDITKKGRLQAPVIPELLQETETDSEFDEEVPEVEAEASTRPQRPHRQRLQQVLKNFTRRYLRGIRNQEFQAFAGFEIMVQNYRIFAFLLWRLFAKEWVEREFLVDALLQTWQFFWGDADQRGYVQSLPEEQEVQVLQMLRETHADAELLAGVYYSAYLSTFERWEQRRFALRDFLRQLLSQPLFAVTEELLEEVWVITADLIRFDAPAVQKIVQVLSDLARYETRTAFLKMLQGHYNFPPGSCRFMKVIVRRSVIGADTSVDCLILPSEDTATGKELGLSVLQSWIKFEQHEYYRISTPGKSWMLYYDRQEPKVLYNDTQGKQILWTSELKERRHPDPTVSTPTAWESILFQMAEFAREIDNQMPLSDLMVG
ncbi:MAG TPA: hypothetical protein VKR06_12000 [Ktedonosporobacter sp.]|nr:hypothetical protein [Ktedonosporobacter sp.]